MKAHKSKVMAAGFTLLFTLPESKSRHNLEAWLAAVEDVDAFSETDSVCGDVVESADGTEVRLYFSRPFKSSLGLAAAAERSRLIAEGLFVSLAKLN